MPKLLIADDHPQIASILSEYARKDGYTVFTASDGLEALSLFSSTSPDLILLDVMMPGRNGFDVCREIRRSSGVPIIMITARGEDFDRIMGLDIGADDYIVKPFSPGEVMARVRAILRRLERTPSTDLLLTYDTLLVNLTDFTARIDNKDIPLTKKEIELLWTLASNRNKVYTRDNLLDILWGIDYYGDNRTVDSHIKRLRAKLDAFPHEGWEIKTIWGVGYKFEVKP